MKMLIYIYWESTKILYKRKYFIYKIYWRPCCSLPVLKRGLI